MLKKIKNIIINFVPQHPAAQGILSLLIELVGETVVRVDPHIGLLKRGTEKLRENKIYNQGLLYRYSIDYVLIKVKEYCCSLRMKEVLIENIDVKNINIKLKLLRKDSIKKSYKKNQKRYYRKNNICLGNSKFKQIVGTLSSSSGKGGGEPPHRDYNFNKKNIGHYSPNVEGRNNYKWFKNIELSKSKMGIVWKRDKFKLNLKYDSDYIKEKWKLSDDDYNSFVHATDEANIILNHPTFVLEFNNNDSVVIIYFTRTNGSNYNLSYFDIDNNRIYTTQSLVSVTQLENIAIGGINICNIQNGSIEEYLLQNEELFSYFELNSNLNYETINEIDPYNYEVLSSILDDFNCDNFEEVKLQLIDQICEQSLNEDIPMVYNGINVTNGLENYNNLSDSQKEAITNLRLKFVSVFIDVVEKIIKK